MWKGDEMEMSGWNLIRNFERPSLTRRVKLSLFYVQRVHRTKRQSTELQPEKSVSKSQSLVMLTNSIRNLYHLVSRTRTLFQRSSISVLVWKWKSWNWKVGWTLSKALCPLWWPAKVCARLHYRRWSSARSIQMNRDRWNYPVRVSIVCRFGYHPRSAVHGK